MTERVYHAWQEQDKFFLSTLPYDPTKRQPANWYDTSTELVAEASRRNDPQRGIKIRIQWHKTGLEAADV